jgi:hypothetical protein
MRDERDEVLTITAAQLLPDGERRYATTGKRDWGDGPWQDEPDKIQWLDAATDLDCLIVRSHTGAWCGYVGVPETHPWFGKGYSESVLDGSDNRSDAPDAMIGVHGGLTYSDRCQDEDDPAAGICHVAGPGRPEPVWWFGFDCNHAGDFAPGIHADLCRIADTSRYLTGYRPGVPPHDEQYRDVAYVRGQVALLAAQLAAVAGEGEDGR